MKYIIYTDGSCIGNPGNGGWAAIIIQNGKKTQIKGSKKETTNNQMELLAPIKALKKIPKGSKVQIFTDSKYVKSGITFDWKGNYTGSYIRLGPYRDSHPDNGRYPKQSIHYDDFTVVSDKKTLDKYLNNLIIK